MSYRVNMSYLKLQKVRSLNAAVVHICEYRDKVSGFYMIFDITQSGVLYSYTTDAIIINKVYIDNTK